MAGSLFHSGRVHPVTGEAGGFFEPEHQIHVLHARVGAAFADAVEDAENDDSVACFIKIQSDVAEIGSRNRRNPRVRAVLPGGASFLGQVKNFDEGFVVIKSAIGLEQGFARSFFKREGVANV